MRPLKLLRLARSQLSRLAFRRKRASARAQHRGEDEGKGDNNDGNDSDEPNIVDLGAN